MLNGERRTITFLIIAMMLFVLLAFGNAVITPFFWDDEALIIKNPLLNRVSGLVTFLSPSYWRDSYFPMDYRPVERYSFWLDHLFWGKNPVGYHISNILLHMINVCAVFFLARMLLRNSRTAVLATLLFALHPMHSEAIIWVQNRSELLAAAFMLAALLTFIISIRKDKQRGKLFIFSILFYICACLTKEHSVILPFLFAIILFSLPPDSRRAEKKRLALFLGLAAIFVFARALAHCRTETGILPSEGHGSLMAHAFTVSKTLRLYLTMLFIPGHFSLDRQLIIPSALPLTALVPAITALVTLALLICRNIPRSRPEATALAFTLISLLPASNLIFLSGRPISEQRSYFASIGICIFIAALVQRFMSHGRIRFLWKFLCGALITTYFLIASSRTSCWYSERVLWERTLEESPGSWKAKCFLARLHRGEGRYDTAIRLLKSVLRYRTRSTALVFLDIGSVYSAMGWHDEAKDFFRRAVKADPDHIPARLRCGQSALRTGSYREAAEHFAFIETALPRSGIGQLGMGLLHNARGNYERALGKFLRALEYNPSEPRALINCASLYDELGESEKAEEIFLQLIDDHPHWATALNDYAVFLERRGRIEEAITYYRKASLSAPREYLPLLNLAELYYARGDTLNALQFFMRAASLRPGEKEIIQRVETLWKEAPEVKDRGAKIMLLNEYARMLNAVGIHYARVGNIAAAKKYFSTLLAVAPENGEGHANLGRLHLEEGKPAQALPHLKRAARLAPDEPAVFSTLGSCYAAMGRREKATEAWERARLLDPEATEPRRNLRRIRAGK